MAENNVVNNTTNKGDEKSQNIRQPNQKVPLPKWYGESYEDTKKKLKVYLAFNSEKQIKFIETLTEKAIQGDPTSMKLFVQMTGNTDPTETKDVTERKMPNPYDKLTEEELRKLAGEV